MEKQKDLTFANAGTMHPDQRAFGARPGGITCSFLQACRVFLADFDAPLQQKRQSSRLVKKPKPSASKKNYAAKKSARQQLPRQNKQRLMLNAGPRKLKKRQSMMPRKLPEKSVNASKPRNGPKRKPARSAKPTKSTGRI